MLRVKEPRRRYVEVIRKGWRASLDSVEAHARSRGGRILKETRYDWRVEMWTPSVDRRYLCGRDDLHLFIARLSGGDTVAQAHESLKPDDVRRVEALTPGAVQRQGEWFFLPPSREESERLDQDLRERSRATRRSAPIGESAHPPWWTWSSGWIGARGTSTASTVDPRCTPAAQSCTPITVPCGSAAGGGSSATVRSQETPARSAASGGSIESLHSPRTAWDDKDDYPPPVVHNGAKCCILGS